MFEKKFHPKIKNDLKKIDKQVIKKIKEIHIQNIAKNPYKYSRLKGNLSNYFSYHFKEKGVDYRIAYEVMEDEKIIIYLIIAKRENFYKNLIKRI